MHTDNIYIYIYIKDLLLKLHNSRNDDITYLFFKDFYF